MIEVKLALTNVDFVAWVEGGEKLSDGGPCYEIAADAENLLCGLDGKIVAWMEENCKRFLGDEFGRLEVGRNLAQAENFYISGEARTGKV